MVVSWEGNEDQSEAKRSSRSMRPSREEFVSPNRGEDQPNGLVAELYRLGELIDRAHKTAYDLEMTLNPVLGPGLADGGVKDESLDGIAGLRQHVAILTSTTQGLIQKIDLIRQRVQL